MYMCILITTQLLMVAYIIMCNNLSMILQIGEERSKPANAAPSIQWDGHTASADKTRMHAQSKVTIQEQLEHIQRVQGLL